ncbi:uncharacterized protein LOC132705192 [Cylas formicarius]|uniref:uncharacterized protein LOC132705192 n=1 Tax=Cylas formicarius TaxID=197179 RepID=UPI00295840ED|nr:uncharacterized protein LOC132705192 [Cylas formicarius]
MADEEVPPPDLDVEPEIETQPPQEEAPMLQQPSITSAPREEDATKAPHAEPGIRIQSATDPLNTEFLYYSAILKTLGPTLSHEDDRRHIIPWIRKLFRPEYQSTALREKRNKYLAFLTTSLLLDEAVSIFRQYPPDGALPDMSSIRSTPVTAAQWEIDGTWQDTLRNLPDNFQMLDCSVHETQEECNKDHSLDRILDQEFQFFLYLAKPYAAMITGGAERTRVSAWLQILCSIHGIQSCSKMKAIRNDYMMALLGYIQDMRVVGPFAELPSWQTLKPLAEAAKLAAEHCPITDPSGSHADEFLAEQPMPDDGAFCYIALTGDLVSGNLQQG